MVKFKDAKVKEQWDYFALPPVKAIVLALDEEFEEDFVITCVKSDAGAHAFGCAVDIRAHKNHFKNRERENRIRAFANKWFPQPGKSTLIWHSGKNKNGTIIRDRKSPNYHGHLQTATFILRR